MNYSLRLRRLSLIVVLTACAMLLPAEGTLALARTDHPQAPQQTSLAAATAAERNGDYLAAESGYRTLAASSDPATAAAARLAIGRFFERHDRSAEAIAPLQAAVAALGATPDGLRASFLLGEAQADQHQTQAAIASFQAYSSGGGPAGGYAALERVWVLQAAADDQGALLALAGPLQAPSMTVRRAALGAASHSHEQLNAPALAAADQQALVDTLPPASDRAAALLEAGRLYQLAGDSGAATSVLQQIVQQYPALAAAGDALDRLDLLGATVDGLQRGVALFNRSRNSEARAALQSVLSGSPGAEIAATATYYLARISDRLDENDDALAGYGAAHGLAPAGSIAADALWRRAELLRLLDRYAEAGSVYASLAQQFPESNNAAEAAFDSGLMTYLDGRPADAATIWTAIAAAATGGDAARAGLWLGKLALARSDPASAGAALAQARAAQPNGYYGLRAEVLGSGATVALTSGAITSPANDWGSVESWLAARIGPEDTGRFQSLQATEDWTEGMELDALGWKATPKQLLSAALDGVSQQPWLLYRAARALSDRGRTDLALDAAVQLLNLAGIRSGGELNAPPTLLRLAYPLDYLDLVNRDAAAAGLDPLLVYALARQESAFDPSAGSSAGAQGLLQLVPATAQGEAVALGLADVGVGDLKRPSINLQLGIAFLAEQARAHGRDLNRSLAAYNAGGGSATRWEGKSGSDPDRFYETIDFSETRLYLRLVSANYAVYNALYRGTSHPTLLHP